MKQAIETQPLIRELKKLLDGITSNFRNTIVQCIKAGELLVKIKSTTKHGDWDDVLSTVGLNFRTAQRWMALWEHRTELKLAEIKTVSDAYNFLWPVGTIPEKYDTNTIATSQNEPLTHEKEHQSKQELTGGTRRDSESSRKPIQLLGGTARAAGVSSQKAVKGAFKADAIPRDNSRAYLNDLAFHVERDEIDPADKVPVSTPKDVAFARAVLEDSNYPKIVQFEVFDCQEEASFRKLSEEILAKRGRKRTPQFDMVHVAISVRNAYKKATGKALSIKPMDVGQIRRLLESGITLEEFLSVGETAWKSNGFFARQSHQLAMFVKHYGNIRNEVTEGAKGNNTGSAQKPITPVRGSTPVGGF